MTGSGRPGARLGLPLSFIGHTEDTWTMNTMPPQETALTVPRQVTVPCQHGLHLRVAAVIVTMAQQFRSVISFDSGSQHVDAKSMLGVLRLGASHGAPLVLTARGEDADRAIQVLGELFESKRTLCRDSGSPAYVRGEDR